METCKPVDTPTVEKSKLDEDPQGKAVDPTRYSGMIGTLMYLTSTFADADHAGCQDIRKSTSESMQLLGERLVSWSSKKQKSMTISNIEAEYDVYTIKKVQGTGSYEFLFANKKCVVDVDVFRTILDICLRVEGVDFTDIPDYYSALALLIELGYKGPLYKHINMFVDHMHQPWRTLEAIINKYLSRKTTRNDKLRKSRIDILWGMFYRENVDYPELIWEDLA
ncbi:hypothetical protein Tco_0011430 [Tanacetum coccineum]